ncbi:hypothetical protein PCE1_002053 [Barthelona sp. PCE]
MTWFKSFFNGNGPQLSSLITQDKSFSEIVVHADFLDDFRSGNTTVTDWVDCHFEQILNYALNPVSDDHITDLFAQLSQKCVLLLDIGAVKLADKFVEFDITERLFKMLNHDTLPSLYAENFTNVFRILATTVDFIVEIVREHDLLRKLLHFFHHGCICSLYIDIITRSEPELQVIFEDVSLFDITISLLEQYGEDYFLEKEIFRMLKLAIYFSPYLTCLSLEPFLSFENIKIFFQKFKKISTIRFFFDFLRMLISRFHFKDIYSVYSSGFDNDYSIMRLVDKNSVFFEEEVRPVFFDILDFLLPHIISLVKNEHEFIDNVSTVRITGCTPYAFNQVYLPECVNLLSLYFEDIGTIHLAMRIIESGIVGIFADMLFDMKDATLLLISLEHFFENVILEDEVEYINYLVNDINLFCRIVECLSEMNYKNNNFSTLQNLFHDFRAVLSEDIASKGDILAITLNERIESVIYSTSITSIEYKNESHILVNMDINSSDDSDSDEYSSEEEMDVEKMSPQNTADMGIFRTNFSSRDPLDTDLDIQFDTALSASPLQSPVSPQVMSPKTDENPKITVDNFFEPTTTVKNSEDDLKPFSIKWKASAAGTTKNEIVVENDFFSMETVQHQPNETELFDFNDYEVEEYRSSEEDEAIVEHKDGTEHQFNSYNYYHPKDTFEFTLNLDMF